MKAGGFRKSRYCDEAAIQKAVQDCDAVVHFAAESHNDNSHPFAWPFVNTNLVVLTRSWKPAANMASACTYLD